MDVAIDQAPKEAAQERYHAQPRIKKTRTNWTGLVVVPKKNRILKQQAEDWPGAEIGVFREIQWTHLLSWSISSQKKSPKGCSWKWLNQSSGVKHQGNQMEKARREGMMSAMCLLWTCKAKGDDQETTHKAKASEAKIKQRRWAHGGSFLVPAFASSLSINHLLFIIALSLWVRAEYFHVFLLPRNSPLSSFLGYETTRRLEARLAKFYHLFFLLPPPFSMLLPLYWGIMLDFSGGSGTNIRQIAVHHVFVRVGNALGEMLKEEWEGGEDVVGILRKSNTWGSSRTIQHRGLNKVSCVVGKIEKDGSVLTRCGHLMIWKLEEIALPKSFVTVSSVSVCHCVCAFLCWSRLKFACSGSNATSW